MGTMADIPQNNTLQLLLNTFTGKKETTTTSPGISSEGMNAMLQSMLGSTHGLAAVSQGQHSAGLYNSTVNQQLVNDLLARSAAEVSKVGTGTTTTKKMAPQLDPKNSLLAGLGIKAGQSLLGPTISGLGKKLGVDTLGKDLADSLGLGASSVGGATDSLGVGLSGLGSDLSTSMSDFISQGLVGTAADFLGSSLSDIGASAATDAAGSAAADAGGNVIGDILAGLGLGGADGGMVHKKMMKGAKGCADGGTIFRAAGGPIPYKKSVISGLPGLPESGGTPAPSGQTGSVAADPNATINASTVASAALGLATSNPIGIVSAAINMGLQAATGKSAVQHGKEIFDQVMAAISSAGSDVGLDGTIGSSGIGLGVSASDANASAPAEGGSSAIGTNSGAPEGSGSGGDSSGPGSGVGDANGGPIPMQSGDPKGINDTIPAKVRNGPKINLSGGEFIIPTDVVDTLGEGFFQRIINAYHTPAAAQRSS